MLILSLSAEMPQTRPYRFSTPSLPAARADRPAESGRRSAWLLPKTAALLTAMAGLAALRPPADLAAAGLVEVFPVTMGLALFFVSVDVWGQRSWAWQSALVLLVASASLRLASGRDLGWGALCITTALLLLLAAPLFSERRITLRGGIARFGGAIIVVAMWGCLVLARMDGSQFRPGYVRWDALLEAIGVSIWGGLPATAPSLAVAWFLLAVQCLGALTLIYGTVVLTDSTWAQLRPRRERVFPRLESFEGQFPPEPRRRRGALA